jgi:long-chain fatty acid transport protein
MGLLFHFFQSSAAASAFSIHEQSARAMGMGGAFTAMAGSSSSTYFNPAGLATLHGLDIEGGVAFAFPHVNFTGQPPGETVQASVNASADFSWRPNLFVAYRLHPYLALGVGVTAPYGAMTQWPDEVDLGQKRIKWWGRNLSSSFILKTLCFNPTVAMEIHPRIALGIGMLISPGEIEMRRAITFQGQTEEELMLEMSGDDVAFGISAGALLQIIPGKINLGLAYRQGLSFKYQGKAVILTDKAIPGTFQDNLKEGEAESLWDLPHVISFGLAAFPLEGLSLAIDLEVTTWSDYHNFNLKFVESDDLRISELKDFRNTMTLRTGAEYQFFSSWPLRLGFSYDPSPIPQKSLSPELPEGDRFVMSIGLGHAFPLGLRADVAYLVSLMAKTNASNASALVGTYHNQSHQLGFSIGYKM